MKFGIIKNAGGFLHLAALFAAFALFAFCAQSAGAKTLTYESAEVGCDWLDVEYETIKIHAAPAKPEDSASPSSVVKGLALGLGTLLTAPFAIFSGEQERYDFSRNADDIYAAAQKKSCAALLQLMEADKKAGKYPAPKKNSADDINP